MSGLIGKKIGMTSVFNEDGQHLACTVVEVGPCVVTQVKTEATDGYNSLQLGFEDKKDKVASQAELGHVKKAKTSAKRRYVEFSEFDFEEEKSIGDIVSIEDVFSEGDSVKVQGVSKGKGFQGVVKRHNFGGVGQATHGQHNRLRAPGAIGACSYPAKVVKGMKMAGRMGGKNITVRNLTVEKIFSDKNLVLIKGAIPGHKGSYVIIKK